MHYYSNSTPIENASLTLDGLTTNSDGSGNFSIADIPEGDYNLTPSKHNDLGAAISAYDASLILRYAVGMIPLTPYQMAAADVSGNGTISAFDASYILKLVVGLITQFPVAEEWRFVPADFSITASNWNNAPTFISFAPLNSNLENQNFLGMIYGDVSGNWSPVFLAKQTTGRVKVSFGETTSAASKNVSVPVQLDGSADIYSGFLKIKFNPGQLIFKEIFFSQTANKFTVASNMQNNHLLIAFAEAEPVKLNSNLLYLNFELKHQNSSVPMELEISTIFFNEGEIAVELGKSKISLSSHVPKDFELGQNYPNPFNSITKINYLLPKAVDVNMIIYDINGCEVRQLVTGKKLAGSHTVDWDMRDADGKNVASGVYIYRIEAKAEAGNLVFTKFRKMILLK